MNFTQEKIFKALKRGGYVIFRPHPINRFSEWGTGIDDKFTSIPTRAAPDLIEARYLVPEPSRPHIDVLLALSLSVGQVSILRAMEQDAGLDRNTLPRGNASFGPFIYRLRGVVVPTDAGVDRTRDVVVPADDVEGLNSLNMIQPAWIHSFPGDYTVYVLTDKGRDALRVLGPGAAGEFQGWIEAQGKVSEPVPSPFSRAIEALLAQVNEAHVDQIRRLMAGSSTQPVSSGQVQQGMGLEDDPFSTHRTKDGLVRISRGGHVVVTLGGERAARLSKALEGAQNEDERQQLLARATGNYWRGNERQA